MHRPFVLGLSATSVLGTLATLVIVSIMIVKVSDFDERMRGIVASDTPAVVHSELIDATSDAGAYLQTHTALSATRACTATERTLANCAADAHTDAPCTALACTVFNGAASTTPVCMPVVNATAVSGGARCGVYGEGACAAGGVCRSQRAIVDVSASAVVYNGVAAMQNATASTSSTYACDTLNRAQIRSGTDAVALRMLPTGCSSNADVDQSSFVTVTTGVAQRAAPANLNAPADGADGDTEPLYDTYFALQPSASVRCAFVHGDAGAAATSFAALRTHVAETHAAVHVRFAFHAVQVTGTVDSYAGENNTVADVYAYIATPTLAVTLCDADASAALRACAVVRVPVPVATPETGDDEWQYVVAPLPDALVRSAAAYEYTVAVENARGDVYFDSLCVLFDDGGAADAAAGANVASHANATTVAVYSDDECTDATPAAFTLSATRARQLFVYEVPFDVPLSPTSSDAAHEACDAAYDDGEPEAYLKNDTWVRFNATASMRCSVSTCYLSPFDSSLVMYDVTDLECAEYTDAVNATQNQVHVVGCNGDGPLCFMQGSPQSFASYVAAFDVVAGHTYALRVGSYDFETTPEVTKVTFACQTADSSSV